MENIYSERSVLWCETYEYRVFAGVCVNRQHAESKLGVVMEPCQYCSQGKAVILALSGHTGKLMRRGVEVTPRTSKLIRRQIFQEGGDQDVIQEGPEQGDTPSIARKINRRSNIDNGPEEPTLLAEASPAPALPSGKILLRNVQRPETKVSKINRRPTQ